MAKRYGRTTGEAAVADGDADAAGGRVWRLRGIAIVPSSVSKLLLGAGVAAAVVVLGVMHRAAVDAGGDSLAGADAEWLAVAGLATVAMWIAGTTSLIGTLPVRLPLGRLFAVQFAASFANHLLPAGSGAAAVNLRFLQRHGVSRGAAVGAVGLNSLATVLTHLVLLAGAVAVAPSTLNQVGRRVPRPDARSMGSLLHAGPGMASALGAAGALVVFAVAWRRSRRWLGRRVVGIAASLTHLVREMKDLKAVLRHPGRAAALWLSSLTLPFLHAVILFSVLRGIGVPLPIGTVMVIYLGVSALAAAVPSPGAIGGLDVALVAGLAAAGAPSAAAFGAVLGYRMITVWLPLPPAACTFAVLLRRRII